MDLYEFLDGDHSTDPLLQKFRPHATLTASGCLQWRPLNTDGYGYFYLPGGKRQVPHKWLFLHLGGTLPDRWTLDHVCRNRGCVNVFSTEHVEPVPHAVNIARAVDHSSQRNAAKTHCPAGHEYVLENTRVQVIGNSTRRRSCKTCARLRDISRPRGKKQNAD